MKPIEIKCSKKQFKRITGALELCVYCPFGKSLYTCYTFRDPSRTCKTCIEKNVRRVDKW